MRAQDITPRPCAHCGTTFTPPSANLKHGTGAFCSQSCAGSSMKGKPRRPALERFWEKVNREGPIQPHCPEIGACWLWTGSRHPDGRGQFHFRGRTYFASIAAFILTYGDPPSDKPWVLHRCDGNYIGCVRPDHLFAGTHNDNMADMKAKGRQSDGTWTKTKGERLATGNRHGSRTHPERVRRGSGHPFARLNESIVRDARMRYSSGGVTVRELAEEAGVKVMTLYNAIRRVSWKHVE